MGYFILFFCLAMTFVVQGQEKLKAEGRIPVMAWIGPPESETTIERYKEMADDGFTHSFTFLGSIAANEKALEVCQATGIKHFIYCPELFKDPEGVAKKFMNHPALAGYHLKDEPQVGDFAELAKLTKRIQAIDNKHWCYINLFPNLGAWGAKNYQDYVNRFVAEIPSEAISFDMYPITQNGKLNPSWYENLEIIAQASQKSKKPFWAFTLAVEHATYPLPKIEHFRLQVFSDLAYGAYGIQYFTYWTPGDYESFKFKHAPIEFNGKKSDTYEIAKQMNEEIKGLSGVFCGSEVISIGHTGTLPKSTKPYVAAAPIESVITEGNGAVVSLLSHNQRRFLVVVNRDYLSALPLTITFDPNAKVASVDKESVLHPIEGKELKTSVDKGDILILSWLVK